VEAVPVRYDPCLAVIVGSRSPGDHDERPSHRVRGGKGARATQLRKRVVQLLLPRNPAGMPSFQRSARPRPADYAEAVADAGAVGALRGLAVLFLVDPSPLWAWFHDGETSLCCVTGLLVGV
jgi:hypothetical protein